MRQPTKEIPRWKRKKAQPVQIHLPKRERKRMVNEVIAATTQTPGAFAPAAVNANAPGPRLAAEPGFRWKRRMPPFAWLAVIPAGFILYALGAVRAAAVLGPAVAVVVILLCRHLEEFRRKAVLAMACLGAVWLPLIAAFGKAAAVGALVSWLPVVIRWCGKFPLLPEETAPRLDPSDYETWNLLANERRWHAHLGSVEELPGGGRRYPIQADGIKTTIGNILSASENVAGAWHKPMTEAYAERDPHGITSRGYLTVLGAETLMKIREWNGAGIDPETGTAIIGRYADGSPVHAKFYTPRYGTRHALVSGTTGSGKSELLNLLVFIALATGWFVPVILDPQEGQSLPFWRDRVLYAAGVEECMAMMNGLHAGMLDRSAYLASLRWEDDGIPMRGMPFFDHALTGLPVPLIIFDEAHMLLKGDTREGRAVVENTVEIGRLGRKTGTALWLATHLPSLSELGGEQALRDMLRGGNVVSMRTANRVATGMLGLEKDPSEIPMFFTDSKETYGLGYVAGPDNRPDAPMRSDLVPKAMRRKVPQVPQLDDRFREAMDRAMSHSRIASVPAPATLAAVPAASEEEAPEGRTAADAILAVLPSSGAEMNRGEILQGVKDKAAEWARDKPFALRTVSLALEKLTESGKVIKPKDNAYHLPKPVLERVK